ncbi:MAG: hypothetical protein R3E39_19870 [Anaerolineae bacterium]
MDKQGYGKTAQGKLKRRIFYTIGKLLVVGLVGFSCWYFYALTRVPFGMMGGDCPESTSYGSVSFTGSVTASESNADVEVHIVANKPKGLCPQSEAINNVDSIVRPGDSFIRQYGIHLGDPVVKITISADGFDSCELGFSGQNTSFDEKIDLQIILDEHLTVIKKSTYIFGVLDEDGKQEWVDAATYLEINAHSDGVRVCPK